MRKKVLIACEESQIECMAFREFGCEAYSCDIKPTSGPVASWHFQCDVREILYYNWDLVIAHPPCTYLSNANPRPHDPEKVRAARDFFYLFYDLDCPYCIENPKPRPGVLPKADFILSPHQVGSDVSKLSYYWIKGVSPLFATSICLNPVSLCDLVRDPVLRSKSFPEVAYLMAYYWS